GCAGQFSVSYRLKKKLFDGRDLVVAAQGRGVPYPGDGKQPSLRVAFEHLLDGGVGEQVGKRPTYDQHGFGEGLKRGPQDRFRGLDGFGGFVRHGLLNAQVVMLAPFAVLFSKDVTRKLLPGGFVVRRSEERRVGKECGGGGWGN